MCSELCSSTTTPRTLVHEMADVCAERSRAGLFFVSTAKPGGLSVPGPFAPKLTPETFAELRRGVEVEVGPVYWMME